MVVQRKPDLTYADVTPKTLYMGRRNFLLGLLATTAVVAGWKKLPRMFAGPATGSVPVKLTGLVSSQYTTTGEKITPENDVTTYNNFYEFGADKGDPSQNARNFVTSPWTVSVEGEVAKPRKFTMDEIMKLAPLEERIYRHRCVEAWSIVVPWIGFPMRRLLDIAEPLGSAKYVAFTTVEEPKVMPGLDNPIYPWPYVEAVTVQEAANDVAFITVGMYGKIGPAMPKQDGAPIRMTVPWKYGFKSGKAFVKASFTEQRPKTTWAEINPDEYGFWANVNPEVPHPRWSQATERVIGTDQRIPTQIYNGYGEFVASLYVGVKGENLFR
jgi:methionine sulfoxide reductase catalytic subunit